MLLRLSDMYTPVTYSRDLVDTSYCYYKRNISDFKHGGRGRLCTMEPSYSLNIYIFVFN